MNTLEKMARAYHMAARASRRQVFHYQSWSAMTQWERDDLIACMKTALEPLRSLSEEVLGVMVGQSNHGSLDRLGAEGVATGLVDAILEGK
jgi:hypothetical protein